MSLNHHELSIVIPAKNESRLLPRLLQSLAQQDYPHLAHCKVFVADAGSVDHTPELALSFRPALDVQVIPGGLPSVGRNAGAQMATSRYVLFIDADMELRDRTLLRRTMDLMKARRLHCATTNIWCTEGKLGDKMLYLGNNLAQYGSLVVKPFSTGMFMMFHREVFLNLGGFNEQALYAEDYLLSKKVSRWRFGIVPGCIETTNRRFQKMGHAAILSLFLKTAVNTWNDQYFLRDQHYWQHEVTS